MSDDEEEPRTFYRYSISLRIQHPSILPHEITTVISLDPQHSWQAGTARRTPKGAPLDDVYQSSYWTAKLSDGRFPKEIDEAIQEALKNLIPHRSFLHKMRDEGGSVELFIGWFFENQCGDVITYQCASLAADLKVDLSFDVYAAD